MALTTLRLLSGSLSVLKSVCTYVKTYRSVRLKYVRRWVFPQAQPACSRAHLPLPCRPCQRAYGVGEERDDSQQGGQRSGVQGSSADGWRGGGAEKGVTEPAFGVGVGLKAQVGCDGVGKMVGTVQSSVTVGRDVGRGPVSSHSEYPGGSIQPAGAERGLRGWAWKPELG